AISSSDYFEKVIIYRKILPKGMKMETLGYYLKNLTQQYAKLQPPRSGFIDSNLINMKHIKLISSRINDKDISSNKYGEPQYIFKLLYRGSRDGFEATSFRQLCGSQYNTVVFVKINQTGKIIGGYNPNNWDENTTVTMPTAITESAYGWRSVINANASDAFIFSFNDGKDIKGAKFSRNTQNGSTRPVTTVHGPYFHCDLFISDKCNQNSLSWYKCCNYQNQDLLDDICPDNTHFNTAPLVVNNTHHFKVDDYEVFQVSKIM
ncbi:10743_t:CDS:1, partial [Ambispora gerdemannii]